MTPEVEKELAKLATLGVTDKTDLPPRLDAHGFLLAVESLVVNVAAPLLSVFDAGQAALPGVNAGSLVAALSGPDATLNTPGISAIVGGTQATWVLAGFLVLFAALTGLLLVRRDVA